MSKSEQTTKVADVTVIDGDLLDQHVDVIVNAWNRNLLPWWLLIPQGVSRAIKRRAGITPFRQLGRKGVIPLGGAVLTEPGRLPYKAIIHVAGINLLWRASERSIRDAVRNAVELSVSRGFESIAFPIIGSGSGGFEAEAALKTMLDELASLRPSIRVIIVRYSKAKK